MSVASRSKRWFLALLAAGITASTFAIYGQAPCSSQPNPILCENALPGNPESEWDISGSGDNTIQGFATDISVNRGDTVHFKIDTAAPTIKIDLYRLGYYAGNGARKVATISSIAATNQPNCLTASATGLIDCGNWAETASWAVPSTAVSGIYIAKLTRLDTSGTSHIVFIVRDDAGTSDVLFQTADPTWQAYNDYGGNSLYVGGPGTNPGRAYKVSYNRPFNTRGDSAQDWLFNAEYPMLRWIEANGYNVSYFTGVDTDRLGTSLLTQHRIFVSTGHDEYWSGPQRAHVETARGSGVNLAFFSGNEVFWKTRWENSIDGSGTPYRTLVSYKETHANAKIDPQDPPTWTGTWRDPRWSPPADGGRPENALTGTIFTVNCCSDGAAITVSQQFASQPFWRNTRVATLPVGGSTSLAAGTLGYEWDENLNNGSRPSGLTALSATTITVAQKLQDYGSTYGSGSATHALTLYRHASGALVFGAGTVQWSWGLDSHHDRNASTPDIAQQQAMVNLFADMGSQPGSLQPGLVSGTTDSTAPTVSMTAPAGGSTVSGTTVTVSATAADNIGVAGVQFKVDGASVGAEDTVSPYSVTWNSTTVANGSHTLTAVARDAAGNTTTATGVTVTVTNAVDNTAPTVSMTAPTGGSTVSGSSVTVSATASDNIGVAGVQFLLDGAATGAEVTTAPYAVVWNTTSSANGTHTLAARARDGAGNTTTSASVTVTVSNVGPSCPCSLWTASAVPARVEPDVNAVELGMKFTTDTAGAISGVRFYKYAQNTGTHTGSLWSTSGTRLATITFSGEGASGWQQALFTTPVAVTANTTYVISYHTNTGYYGVTQPGFSSAIDNSPVHAPSDAASGGNGLYQYSAAGGFPNQSYNASNYWVDVVFSPGPVDTTVPTVSLAAPANGATVSGAAVTVSATASDNVAVAGVQFKLDGANLGAEDTASPYSIAWNSTTVANGSHTLTAVARDAAGNTATATTVTVTVSNADTTAPTVAMSAPANGATVSGTAVTVSATASDNIGVAGVQFKLDGANLGAEDTVSPYSITWNSTTVANGSHTLTAVARDAAGNTATATTFTVTVNNDTTVPTVAMSAPASGVTVFGTVAVSATAADNVGVAGVQFKLDGANLGAEDTASPYSVNWNTTTAATGSHTLTAVARDAAGNTTTATTVTVTVNNNDITAPTVSMTAPANGATVSGTTVTVSATASDNIGVAGVQFQLDGVNLGAEDTASPYTLTWNSTTVANGSHTLTAVARDAAGNTTTATTFTVTVNNDTTAPTVSLTAPANGVTVFGTVAVSATAADNVAVAGVQFKLDGANLGAEDTASPYSVSWNTTTAATGSHTLTAVARDAAGNTTTATTLTVTVNNNDITAPTVSMTAPANGATVSGTTVTVSATASDNIGVAGVQFQLDGANLGAEDTVSPYSVTWNSTTVANGGHTLTAVARDAAGNTTTATTFTVTVNNDTTVPTVAMSAPASGATVSGTVTVSATASDNVGVAGVQFKLDGANLGAEDTASPYSLAWNSTTVANGSHTLTAVARDAAGNTATATSVTVTVSNTGPACPCSIWNASAVPARVEADPSAVELGLKFTTDTAGFVTGVRFYKYAQNTGTHTGSLWSATGTRLGTVTFSGETASGWQQALFTTPIAVAANTTYLISYHTNTGYYGVTEPGLTTAVDNAPLHALADGTSGGNGVYVYSAAGGFPNQTWDASNYWVDVVFTP